MQILIQILLFYMTYSQFVFQLILFVFIFDQTKMCSVQQILFSIITKKSDVPNT